VSQVRTGPAFAPDPVGRRNARREQTGGEVAHGARLGQVGAEQTDRVFNSPTPRSILQGSAGIGQEGFARLVQHHPFAQPVD